MAKKKEVLEKNTVVEKAKVACAAALELAKLKDVKKRRALKSVAKAIRKRAAEILAANAEDVADAEKQVAAGKLSKALLKRLIVNEAKIEEMAAGVESVAHLEDPAGRVVWKMEMDRGLILERVSVPIGVIGAVFEARPDAAVQISALCLKSGNAVILKGGAEALRSNQVLVNIIREAAASIETVPQGWIQLIETRDEVRAVLELDEYIDLLVPRGSNAFVKYIQDNTRIPVLGHADGICHVYVAGDANLNLALAICNDSKTNYPAACNAAETLLVHETVAETFLPDMVKWFSETGVEVRGCAKTRKIVKGVKPAKEEDWSTEYLDLIISIKVVENIDEAIAHINKYGSGHTDAIVTRSRTKAKKFFESVDSACVFHNCSTRFSDGFRFGLGAEIGISTNKTHARGPVGLEGLVIYNYRLKGRGQIVDDYSGVYAKKFTHRKMEV